MSLESGSVTADAVTADMEVLISQAWRPVLVGAEVTESRSGRRAKFAVGGSKETPIDMAAHATIRARLKSDTSGAG